MRCPAARCPSAPLPASSREAAADRGGARSRRATSRVRPRARRRCCRRFGVGGEGRVAGVRRRARRDADRASRPRELRAAAGEAEQAPGCRGEDALVARFGPQLERLEAVAVNRNVIAIGGTRDAAPTSSVHVMPHAIFEGKGTPSELAIGGPVHALAFATDDLLLVGHGAGAAGGRLTAGIPRGRPASRSRSCSRSTPAPRSARSRSTPAASWSRWHAPTARCTCTGSRSRTRGRRLDRDRAPRADRWRADRGRVRSGGARDRRRRGRRAVVGLARGSAARARAR